MKFGVDAEKMSDESDESDEQQWTKHLLELGPRPTDYDEIEKSSQPIEELLKSILPMFSRLNQMLRQGTVAPF